MGDNGGFDEVSPFKNIEDGIEYRRKYFQKNKARIYKLKVATRKIYIKLNPWYRSYEAAKSRCNNKNNQGYKWYGGKGIKFEMTLKQVRYLWIRDRADTLKWPSIDRVNSNGNYEISNCRFIEQRINSRGPNRALSIPD